MAFPKAKHFTSWSFSRYSDWRKCPARAKYKHLDKLPEPESAAMNRGSEIHTLAEHFVQGKKARLPGELKPLETEFKRLKAIYKKKVFPMVVEDQWAFTIAWEETRWNDWDKCWVRIKLDLAHHEDASTVVVTDWKTGKFRDDQAPEYLEQLELYALSALLKFPHADSILPRLGYIDQGFLYPDEDSPLIYTRAQEPKLKKAWDKRVKPMMADRKFAPKPSNACRWCAFSSAKGGPCKY
jgi:RecB family exonuclease